MASWYLWRWCTLSTLTCNSGWIKWLSNCIGDTGEHCVHYMEWHGLQISPCARDHPFTVTGHRAASHCRQCLKLGRENGSVSINCPRISVIYRKSLITFLKGVKWLHYVLDNIARSSPQFNSCNKNLICLHLGPPNRQCLHSVGGKKGTSSMLAYVQDSCPSMQAQRAPLCTWPCALRAISKLHTPYYYYDAR